MAKINSSDKKIYELKDYGVCGYSVQFSIKDLYNLDRLADIVMQENIRQCKEFGIGNPENTAAAKLAQTIFSLTKATIGVPADTTWDFLQNEGAE